MRDPLPPQAATTPAGANLATGQQMPTFLQGCSWWRGPPLREKSIRHDIGVQMTSRPRDAPVPGR
jgi:hypothetical protein